MSAYAVAANEWDRRRAHERARVERVLEAVRQLTQAAIEVPRNPDREAALQVARRQLRAELKIVDRPLTSTELMTRPDDPQSILDQGEAAIIELAAELNELAPQPLFRHLFRAATVGH